MDFLDYDTRLAAYGVVVDDQERILLVRFNQGRTPVWTLPGGGVELDETVEDGMIREVREETGYDVRVGRLLTIYSHVIPADERIMRTERPMKYVRVVFRAHVVGGELTHELDGTTDQARWVALPDLAALPQKPLVAVALESLESLASS